ncbi:hypothetical protein B0T24DRAFT_722199 [Lasiosphaeria ovina]|uniref:Uncharacterized protein n=1 Tax=Lasiosphaeria ovina TaxID=92902 RepID=A0AAE0K401_9PEZI|nr:hypothetical protein B0T24DRAFT_722199 [Lasiosphaeria ovina]
MDQVLLDRLLGDATLFAPTGGHRAIEIYQAGNAAGEPQVQETVLAEKQVSAWCREGQQRRERFSGGGGGDDGSSLFRLLVCSPRVLDRDIWPLPVSSSTLAAMLHSLDIPALFPRAVCRHVPLATAFESLDTGAGADGFGILLRTNLSHTWQYALALAHDPATRTTTALLFGLRSTEADEVLQSVRHSARHLAACPAVLPCILMDRGLDELVRDAEERRRSLTQIRIETGSQGFHHATIMAMRDDRDDLDLDVLMQKLTSLSDSCSGMAAVCKMQHSFVDVVSAFETATTAIAKSSSGRYARQQLRFFGQFLHGVESKVAYTKASVQDQVQTIYTLISQRDSRNHMALARTTRRLAQLSRKDSTDMRVISAVTLVFLPATFTSTLFSASFFDFQPRAPADKVSPWIWLYCLVTALLTCVVLASWWHFSRRQHVKADAAARRESKHQHQHQNQNQNQNQREDRDDDETLALDTHDAPSPVETVLALGRRARIDDFRPYLGGSISEGMFARKVTLPFDSPSRTETVNISPTEQAPAFRFGH